MELYVKSVAMGGIVQLARLW